jgi:hypothetical protein
MIEWFIAHAVNFTAVGAAIAFVFSVFQFLSVRKREAREREFEQYHTLIERLVSPGDKGQPFLDRQIATVFELRHYTRYYDCTTRILKGFKQTACNQSEFSRLGEEIDLTLKYIGKKK